MKKFIYFISSAIINIVKFAFIFCLMLIIFTFIFSYKNNITISDTIEHFKAMGEGLIFSKNNTSNNMVNTATDISSPSVIEKLNNKYYYNQLDDNSKIIYNALENNIENLKKENYIIDFSTTFNSLLNEINGQKKLNKVFQSALDAFSYDHPELFYIDITKISITTKCMSIGSLKTYSVQMCPHDNKNYLNSSFNSEFNVDSSVKKVENIKNNIINSVSTINNTYDKIKLVHDTLVETIEYDSTYNQKNTHNIYGALVEKKVVCEGYAKAFKYLMDCLNIECILVSGNATNSDYETEAHMWNYVKIDDSWYGVDVTWDDPIIIGGTSNIIRRNYLMKGYYTFSESHIPSGKISVNGMMFSLPILSNSNYNR